MIFKSLPLTVDTSKAIEAAPNEPTATVISSPATTTTTPAIQRLVPITTKPTASSVPVGPTSATRKRQRIHFKPLHTNDILPHRPPPFAVPQAAEVVAVAARGRDASTRPHQQLRSVYLYYVPVSLVSLALAAVRYLHKRQELKRPKGGEDDERRSVDRMQQQEQQQQNHPHTALWMDATAGPQQRALVCGQRQLSAAAVDEPLMRVIHV